MIEEAKRQGGEKGREDGKAVVAEIAKAKEAFLAEWGSKLHSEEVPINPYRVITELSKAVDVSNTIITHDSGFPRDQFVPFWEPVSPRGYLGWGKSTQLGYGLGLALGAKMAAPEKQVINVMGDASFGMAGMDVETGVRSEIPIMTVVLNNGVMTNYSNYMPLADGALGQQSADRELRGGGESTRRLRRASGDCRGNGASISKGCGSKQERSAGSHRGHGQGGGDQRQGVGVAAIRCSYNQMKTRTVNRLWRIQ